MPSAVDICNLALANLGDTATVSSIDPPEGSAQAEHCARFYPIARDSVLEMHPWSFSTRRESLALLDAEMPNWRYVYKLPAGVINVIAVLPPDMDNDYSVSYAYQTASGYRPDVLPLTGYYVPQPFQISTLSTGVQVILTNQENALLRYTARVIDTTQFSPLFVDALSWYLSAKLAGPLIKGDVGAAEAKRCMAMFTAVMAEATTSDANQRYIKPQQNVSWIAGR